MKGSALARKLLIEPGQRVLLMNAPAGYIDQLQPLPEDASATEQVDGPRDVVQLFSRDRAELESHAAAAMKAVKPGGVPVVPVGLSGTKDLWLRKKIDVLIGVPISPAGKTVDDVLSLGANAVRNLLPPYTEPPGRKRLRRWLTGLF